MKIIDTRKGEESPNFMACYDYEAIGTSGTSEYKEENWIKSAKALKCHTVVFYKFGVACYAKVNK